MKIKNRSLLISSAAAGLLATGIIAGAFASQTSRAVSSRPGSHRPNTLSKITQNTLRTTTCNHVGSWCQGWINNGASGVNNQTIGLYGTAPYGVGVAGYSGVAATTKYSIGVEGYNAGIGGGVEGVYTGNNTPGPGYGLVGDGGTSGTGIMSVVYTANDGHLLYQGFTDLDGSLTSLFSVDDSGNVNIAGMLTVVGGCTGCTATKRMTSYGERSTVPEIEDVGEGVVRDGHAYVAIDASLSHAIDATHLYVVTLTPEGDSDGLYVTSRTPRGFEVRENRNGRSTLGFSYRIVAHPFGAPSARLPMTDIAKGHSPFGA